MTKKRFFYLFAWPILIKILYNMESKKCACGCEQYIIEKPYHKYYGLPTYIQGHQLKGKPKSEEHKKHMTGIVKTFKPIECLECKTIFTPKSSKEQWCTKCSKEKRKKYCKKYEHEYYWNNIEKLREDGRKKSKQLISLYRNKVLDSLGRKCIKCGFSDERALQIDHIYGGGNKERKELNLKGTVTKYYKYILKELETNQNKYQLLCANCNWIKRYENNEH